MRPRRLGGGTAAALPAGLVAALSHATEQHPPPRRIVENLDRGLVAVPSGKGTFLSRRLLGTEYALRQVLGSARTRGTPTGDAIAFNVYKGGRRLDQAPVTRSTTYQDDSRGTGTCTVRAVANGHERKPSSAALDLARGYAEIPPAAADGYTVQHAWPGDLDGGRGSAADIDPGQPGYAYWTSTTDVTRPGEGVFNVQDGKVSTTTPGVNFRIWWDGDKGAELLDPAGVVSGARNATPFYGDLLGDWREEILAETGDHTAPRLYITTEPTKTRIHTLAQNPGHRLGWTVRGSLQSTYTDHHLGTETRRVPKPAITTAARTEGTS
ncbi:hypothetical protein [Streptomyces sp. NPDC097610]|uniref:rhamnogalacturonan lyase family protein n=1 Tax=Streptomyces sp. NPDC097610 TaxID=3157227 RepID=UPI00332AB858